jgi:hypothetical protein
MKNVINACLLNRQKLIQESLASTLPSYSTCILGKYLHDRQWSTIGMRINEYIPMNGRYNGKENQYYPAVTRHPRLTLKHLNKLRKIRYVRRLEQLKHDGV